MSSHVYPYTFSFKDRHGKPAIRTILVDSTRSRKKDWVIRVKDNWDTDWVTAVNVTEEFGAFEALSKIDSKFFVGLGELHREMVGGKLGYSSNSFYWNLMEYALVQAIRENHVGALEDETTELPAAGEKLLRSLPAPDKVEGQDAGPVPDLPRHVLWHCEGPSYRFNYLGALEQALKSINFKILTHF